MRIVRSFLFTLFLFAHPCIHAENPFLIPFPDKKELTNDDYVLIQKQLRAVNITPLLKELHADDPALVAFEDFQARCTKGLKQTLIDREKGFIPEKKLVKIGSGGGNCVVCCCPYDIAYPELLRSITASLESVGFNGYFYYRIGGFPNPTGKEGKYAGVPYCFKILMMLEAQNLGFNNVLWIDSSILFLKNPTPIFEEIEKQGSFLLDFVNRSYDQKRTFPKTKELLTQLTGVDIFKKHFVTQVFGLKLDNERTKDFVQKYYQFLEMGTPFLSCFPEEIVMASIFLQNESEWPTKYLHTFTIYHNDEEDTPEKIQALKDSRFYFYLRHHLPKKKVDFSSWDVPEDFIWEMGLAAKCDIGMDKNPLEFGKKPWKFDLNQKDFENVKSGDLIWMKPASTSQFCREIAPNLKVPVVLVINNCDLTFPSDCISQTELEGLLANPNIIHIFAENCDYAGPSNKISLLPIGIDFHSLAYVDRERDQRYQLTIRSPSEQVQHLKNILATLQPTCERKKRAFVDFQHSDSMGLGPQQRHLKTGETRTSIFNYLLTTNLIDYGPKISRDELWKKKGEYAFSISPHGNGLDCYRTWEDLALGCIVIVKTSSLDPLYEGLPVVIVKDWSEVNEENFDKWLKEYGDAFTNPSYRERLTHTYWMNKIRKAAEPYK